MTSVHVLSDSYDVERSEIGPLSDERERDQREELLRALATSRTEQLASHQLEREREGMEVGL
jgi:hypothetical protein